MAPAVSALSHRFERMPGTAVALAVLLHGAIAAAIWWANRTPPQPPVEDVIQVSFELPKPPEPPPQKPPEPPRPTILPPVEGIRPPADIVADKATQAPPRGDKPKDADLAPPPPPLRDTDPARDPPSQPAQTAMMQPEPMSPPLVAPPRPPVPAPTPPAAAAPPRAALAPSAPAGMLPKPPEMPPVPAPEKAPEPKLPEPDKAQKHDDRKPPTEQKPAAAATPAPASPRPPAPAIPQHEAPKHAPSPLSTLPSHKPPAGTRSDNPSPSPFVNPADTYSRARVADNYLWQVVRRLQGYRYSANVNARQGLTVVRVVIARDGRLLDVKVTRSSGYPEFDNGVLQGVRSGSPYAPLPPEIKGDSAAFDLPLMSVNRGG